MDPRYSVHSVRFGRSGRQGWLQVDQAGNITGRSPGARANLNVSSPLLFVGGHENHNFSLLPHDLPVHRGFDGCIFDLSVRSAEATQVICRYFLVKFSYYKVIAMISMYLI